MLSQCLSNFLGGNGGRVDSVEDWVVGGGVMRSKEVVLLIAKIIHVFLVEKTGEGFVRAYLGAVNMPDTRAGKPVRKEVSFQPLHEDGQASAKRPGQALQSRP